jgi:2-methylisocitrate lyase-like PEP mutase family enzyme
MSPSQPSRIARFRELHQSACFVLPNPWDVGTAIALEQMGFRALATTSAGVAFSRGRPDATPALPLDEMLTHVRDVAAATSLPVNADFQSGYASDAAGVAANVARCAATGVAGLSIEDSTGDRARPLFERAAAVERVRAARVALDADGRGVLLTARCEAWLVGDPEPARTAIDRLVAYADAGAECLYAPGVRDLPTIRAIVAAVAPKPVNVLVSAPGTGLSVASLADAGVRRISVGSALARVAWRAFLDAARRIAASGEFDALAGAAPFAELDALFRARGG